MSEYPTPPRPRPYLNMQIIFKWARHLQFPSLHDQKIKKKEWVRGKKKKNVTESEMEVILSEVEARKYVLFGTLSTGISNKRKRSGWESVCEAVNAVGSEKRTQAEVKKKRSDIIIKDRTGQKEI